MAATEVRKAPWTRKHDEPGVNLIPSAPTIAYPTCLEDLIDLLKNREPTERLHAAGSHWGLSHAAVSDDVFVETHDPNNLYPAMGRTLYEVVPGCLSKAFIDCLDEVPPKEYDTTHCDEDVGLYPFHIETGKRVYQAYAEMDAGDDRNRDSLAVHLQRTYDNPAYLGPWAFRTLGGAGGQTVFGALTTGTHGGDFRAPPIADSVLALHLVTDGGKHYWIEPAPGRPSHQMTDDAKLRALYGADRYGGPCNFEIRRDDDLFNAVLMSAGRFGIVYSVVLGAVRQYTLHEERRLRTWQEIKPLIAEGLVGELFNRPAGMDGRQKFLQIAVSLTTHDNFRKNLCGVTRRWNVPLVRNPVTGAPVGRAERVGTIAVPFDPQIAAPRFSMAGNSHGYSPSSSVPDTAAPPSFLDRACSNADFMLGVIETVAEEIRQFLATNTVPVAGTIAAIAAVAGVATLTALAAALAIILTLLLAFLAGLSASGNRLGETLDELRHVLLDRSDPAERAAGVFVWQCIAYKLFESQQSHLDYDAISYAVMDGHNYLDRSCNLNVDSVEVFFDASDPMLIAFVDALIAYETRQEFSGRAFVGYASLRFTGATRALIGPERAPLTCVVEVGGLTDIRGSAQLVAYAESLARNRNVSGILHWGQRNNSTAADIEHRFGDSVDSPGGALGRWRDALASVTDNGRLDGCSSAFTRRTGLEVVQPAVGRVSVEPPSPTRESGFTLHWDCVSNPPRTEVHVTVRTPAGVQTAYGPLSLTGQMDIPTLELGTYRVFVATAAQADNGEWRQEAREIQVVVT
ncbi:hypothetical protein [Streptomyces avermitilis]|uniref:hypothetical protein n=1 Tax=Streptomyces avermitilis TaxID=33903 RepID=UPI0033BE2B6D